MLRAVGPTIITDIMGRALITILLITTVTIIPAHADSISIERTLTIIAARGATIIIRTWDL